MSPSKSPGFRLSLTLCRWLLRGYPPVFRHRFGPQMVEDFRESLTWERRRGPVSGRMHAWMPVLLDLVSSVPRERAQAWRERRNSASKRHRQPPGEILATTLQDVRFALRSLRRRPLFSVMAMTTLGLGMGAATGLFSLADAVLLEPLPFPDPGSLMRPSIVIPPKPSGPTERQELVWSVPKYEVFKASQASFSASALYKGRQYTHTGEGGPERLQGEVVEGSYLDILGVDATVGRGLAREDDRPEADRVVVLGHGLWIRRWGGDQGILGRTLTISGVPFTVVGVLPRGFRGR
jgi:hypothetical protein